jgi:hypothetical protein
MKICPRRRRNIAQRKAVALRKVTLRKVTTLKCYCAEVPAAGKARVDPLSILNKLHPYLISLLAGCADNEFNLSGSRSVGGANTDDSDFDMYGRADLDAVTEMLHLLSLAHVRWDNLLLRRLEDVAGYRLTILPYKEIYVLARRLPSY